MNRRLSTLTLAALALALGFCLTSRAEDAKPHALPGSGPARPNVIFILADDLGYGDLGCFGQKLIRTPNIDRLAAEGMRFTQAYAGSTVCAPSRCTLMTGLHTGHCPIRGNKEFEPEGQAPMPAGTFTVAQLMKQAGYSTALIGKWGLGKPDSESLPNKMGFDYFYGYNCQMKAHEYYPEYLWRNNEKVMLNGKAYSHDLMAEEALGWVKTNQSKPFFLYLAFTIPHAKMQVPELTPYENESWPANLKTLAAMVTRLDRDVGRLMALLRELKLDENTLVFFASDNGTAYQDALFNHSGPLRGMKREMYEGGLRSPSIARWPGKVKAGSLSSQVWAFWDFLPTMAALTGQPTPAHLDGISVLPALLEGRTVEHPPLYFEFHERGFTQGARMGDWKAVRLGKEAPLELYDLSKDIGESHNLAAQQPERVKQFEVFLKGARVDSELWPIQDKPVQKKAPGKGKGKGKGKAKAPETTGASANQPRPLFHGSADLESAVSQICNLRAVRNAQRVSARPPPAGCKPAIQQIANLRYQPRPLLHALGGTAV